MRHGRTPVVFPCWSAEICQRFSQIYGFRRTERIAPARCSSETCPLMRAGRHTRRAGGGKQEKTRPLAAHVSLSPAPAVRLRGTRPCAASRFPLPIVAQHYSCITSTRNSVFALALLFVDNRGSQQRIASYVSAIELLFNSSVYIGATSHLQGNCAAESTEPANDRNPANQDLGPSRCTLSSLHREIYLRQKHDQRRDQAGACVDALEPHEAPSPGRNPR